MELALDVAGSRGHVKNALARFTADELLTGDNKYRAKNKETDLGLQVRARDESCIAHVCAASCCEHGLDVYC